MFSWSSRERDGSQIKSSLSCSGSFCIFFFSILQEKFGEPADQDSQELFGLISQFVHDFRRAHAEVIWGVQPVLHCVHVGSLRDNNKTCQPKHLEKATIVDKFIKCFRSLSFFFSSQPSVFIPLCCFCTDVFKWVQDVLRCRISTMWSVGGNNASGRREDNVCRNQFCDIKTGVFADYYEV